MDSNPISCSSDDSDAKPIEAKLIAHDSKLIDLEQQLAFQQRAFEELNSVVLEQQSSIDEAQREIKKLKQLLQQLSDQGVGDALPHEKPPHY